MANAEKQFSRLAKKAFEFLVDEFGFGGPKTEIFSMGSILTYEESLVKVAIQLDLRDRMIWIEFLIAEKQGAPESRQPTGEIGELLELRAPWEFEHRRVLNSPPTPDELGARLRTLAALVKLHCRDVLNGDSAVLRHLGDQRPSS